MNEQITIAWIVLIMAQYYVCWMTYLKWFNSEITHIKMKDSRSIWVMVFLLPNFVWVPVFPIIVMAIATGWRYLTARWYL